ncbi:hypothetical protein HOLleu_21841 [Holothuria leucospilota]|uniref:Uncharacterized protein n=1 Tax=Holothuria leucospilota TaxID=206669 RepID=A0A9Q1BYF9_HOLLE|nr:hypothetical protein HOLleu_21841 [Holothuria leucospilota]
MLERIWLKNFLMIVADTGLRLLVRGQSHPTSLIGRWGWGWKAEISDLDFDIFKGNFLISGTAKKQFLEEKLETLWGRVGGVRGLTEL